MLVLTHVHVRLTFNKSSSGSKNWTHMQRFPTSASAITQQCRTAGGTISNAPGRRSKIPIHFHHRQYWVIDMQNLDCWTNKKINKRREIQMGTETMRWKITKPRNVCVSKTNITKSFNFSSHAPLTVGGNFLNWLHPWFVSLTGFSIADVAETHEYCNMYSQRFTMPNWWKNV